MKKTLTKILSVILIVCITLTSAPLSGIVGLELPEWLDFSIISKAATTSGTCGENLTWSYDTSSYTLTILGAGDMYDYSDGRIRPWESYVDDIKKILINDGVTKIGVRAFYDFNKLATITIPNNVTTIGEGAFYSCDKLTDIIVDNNNQYYSSDEYGVLFDKNKTTLIQYPIGNSRTSYTIPNSVITIGDNAFYYCQSLKSVIIGNSVTIIGDDAFNYCMSLTNVTIPNGVEIIGNSAFYNCQKLMDVLLPNSVTTIEDYAFRYCFNLRNLTIGNSVTKIGNYAFEYCGRLTNVTIPDSVTKIGAASFENCSKLTSVTIGNSVTTIGNGAFYLCTNLTDVSFSSNVTTIGDSAFYNCSSLADIIIPDTVTSIGSNAFSHTAYYDDVNNWENDVLYIGKYLVNVKDNVSGLCTIKEDTVVIADSVFNSCDNLTGIIVDSNNQNFSNDEYGVLFDKNKTTLLKYPKGNSKTSYAIPNSVITIDDYAFYECNKIKNVSVGNSVISIGKKAFYYCESLASVTIPDSVTTIGDGALCSCKSLASVDVDSNNKHFSSDEYGVLFDKDKTKLIQYPRGNSRTSYIVPKGVTTIGDDAFYYCINLMNVFMPESVVVIGDRSFDNCKALTDITIPESVTTIGSSAFHCCESLTTISIPDNVKSINNYTFNGCSGLEYVTIGDGVTLIGHSAFSFCENIKSVIIGDSVTTIERLAFEECDSLISITIPDSVTKIHSMAFKYCDNLTDVYYSGTENDWNKIAISSWNGYLLNAILHYNSVGRMASIVAECEVGDVIEFGSYPQSEITDETLLAELNSLELDWISYDYYSGTGYIADGEMISDDYMKYADVSYKGNKYRAVKFTEYRPRYTSDNHDNGSCQEDNGYYTNKIYWFKFESLMWRVLDPNEGLIMCESVIDSQPYNNTIYLDYCGEYYQDTHCANYANDYSTSSIRSWLNYDFYNTTFLTAEKFEIQKSKLYNNCWRTGYPQYDSDTTYDKIFLLSYDDIKNSEYGFSANTGSNDIARQSKSTDYAKVQGLFISNDIDDYLGNSCWWLRSPYHYSFGAKGVGVNGCSNFFTVHDTFRGIRPALKFNPKNETEECKHNYAQELVVPTCIEQGYITYTCSACGDTYISDYVDALGHTDGDIVEENCVAPTCTATGSKDNVTYCTVCSEETSRETIMISALGHDIITDEAVAPDCTNTGLTAGEHCSRCDYKVEQTIVDALGHKYESVVTAPTCTAQGFTTYTCHCGDTYTSDYVVASGHNYKDGICTNCDTPDPSYFTFEIQKPSTTTIRCKDGIKLHAKTTGKLPDGARIEWSKNNNNFDVNTSASGNEITIISKNNGYTTFTATIYDADNNVIAQDTIEMYSKAGLFDKIGGFFRSLFGSTKIYDN